MGRSYTKEVSWVKETKDGLWVELWIQPGASRTEVVGFHGEPARLKIKLQAPPVDGKANEALLKFLSKTLGRPKSSLQILRGETSKLKSVLISGLHDPSLLDPLLKATKKP